MRQARGLVGPSHVGRRLNWLRVGSGQLRCLVVGESRAFGKGVTSAQTLSPMLRSTSSDRGEALDSALSLTPGDDERFSDMATAVAVQQRAARFAM